MIPSYKVDLAWYSFNLDETIIIQIIILIQSGHYWIRFIQKWILIVFLLESWILILSLIINNLYELLLIFVIFLFDLTKGFIRHLNIIIETVAFHKKLLWELLLLIFLLVIADDIWILSLAWWTYNCF
jgi:hypothetical protein